MDRQKIAVFVVFALNGGVYGSWATRVPALADQVHAGPGAIGLALLGASFGMVVSTTFSARLMAWIGARGVMIIAGAASAAIPILLGVVGTVPLVWLVLFALGIGVGLVDVAMNMGAVLVERRTGRAIMPVFHAGFSLGGLVGSGGSAFAAAHGLDLAPHLTIVAVVELAILAAVLRWVPGESQLQSAEPPAAGGAIPFRRIALWLLAGVALCSAIAEGATADWSAMLLVKVHGMTEGAAALAFSAFSVTMIAARLGGAWLQRLFGPTKTLALGAAIAGVGLLAAALVPVAWVAYPGFALAGLGLASSFPIALSLAGEAGKRSDGSGGEREIAFVTGIAYTGFLAGPPAIGAIAELTSLSVSFVVIGLVGACIAPAALLAHRARLRERALHLPVG
ncbi:MFS transporter [Amycolatopsis sp. cg5]|uniref:MFS transporter n=1 Tax=Amycolatopsis sp. cg5 TaxID=3238802 RepID=UPI0035253D6E